MPQDAIESFLRQCGLIASAPVPAIGALVAAISFTWLACRAFYKERLETKDATIESYKAKLDGASPEEARRRLDALEATVRRLEAEADEVANTDFAAIFDEALKDRPVDGGTF